MNRSFAASLTRLPSCAWKRKEIRFRFATVLMAHLRRNLFEPSNLSSVFRRFLPESRVNAELPTLGRTVASGPAGGMISAYARRPVR